MKLLSERDENNKPPRESARLHHLVGMKPLSERDENNICSFETERSVPRGRNEATL